MVNLSRFLKYHAIRIPNNPAVIYGDIEISYADLWGRVQKLAGFLASKGVGQGDAVALFMKNSPAFIEFAFATSYLGAILLPINFRLARDEVDYITTNAGAKLLVGDEEFAANLDVDKEIILLGAAEQANTDHLIPTDIHIPEEFYSRPENDFRLMYTSGTTDRPKGVVHSYQNFYWKSMEHAIVLGLTANTRLLMTGPLYHVGAFDLPGVAVLWYGGVLNIHREFDPEAVLKAIETHHLNGAWLAPVMLSAILSHPNAGKYDVSSLKWCIGGGEKTPESRIRQFTELFQGGRYIDAYGLTETCSGDTFMEAGREIEKIGSTGRATPHVDISIRDDGGETLPSETEGEICLRGPKVSREYWKDEEKTKLSRYGEWFRTGDVGYLDSEGFLYLTDRKKDMIISGGENIASSEVERIVYQLPGVLEVAVIGIPDDRWGEIPAAIIVLEEGSVLDVCDLETHCRKYLAGFKVPKRYIFREYLPRNPSGKVLKRVLRDEIKQ